MAYETLCYYVTGHGYGHAIRTTQILKALPSDLRLLVKTTAPARLFQEELPGRDLHVIEAEYDCGSVQKDNLTVLPRETLDRYREISARNRQGLTAEVGFLRGENVACVVSDIASFPLHAAREAGIPAVAVANFTWADIYQDYVQTPQDAELLQEMRGEYGAATAALITPLSLPTVGDPFPSVERVPLVARRGDNIRARLYASLGLPVGTRLALPYLGVWGMEIAWEAVAALTDWVFLTYDPIGSAAENIVCLDRTEWPYADVAASVDVILAKPGYGTVTECIANGTPLIYVPRTGFREQDALIEGITRWGGGVPINEAAFLAGRWGSALEQALIALPDAAAFPIQGAERIADRLVQFCRGADQD